MAESSSNAIPAFHYRDFANTGSLVRRKEQAALSISLVIPACNEARTIGSIVMAAHEELVRKFPLLDEIIVIDGNSTDDTRRIAEQAGARVYACDGIGPSLECTGKGTSLWKSQFIARGDVIVFVDADVLNFAPHFVSALAGPLLHDEDIYFVKAFYRRPLVIEEKMYENYGGRITEILIRPFLSAVLPDLSRIYQPLGGEYALRRNVLESLPLSSGYGVEIGLLLDYYARYGTSHIAQVDIEKRIHRNRTVSELGKEAFGVLQVLLRKFEQQNIVSLSRELHSIMISPNGGNRMHETDLREIEIRPKQEFAMTKSSRGR